MCVMCDVGGDLGCVLGCAEIGVLQGFLPKRGQNG